MFLKKDKRGFTLVELLLVMAIVGVLSTLAVNGYNQYRRSALLDLSADSIVSQIYELRDEVKYGSFGEKRFEFIKESLGAEGESPIESGMTQELGSDDFAQCRGLYLLKKNENFDLKSFMQIYKGRKVFEQGIWKESGCSGDLFDLEADFEKIELDETIFIESVWFLDGERRIEVNSEVFLRFLPPDGEIELSLDGQGFEGPYYGNESLEIVISFGQSDELTLKRKIVFNLSSGTATVGRVY